MDVLNTAKTYCRIFSKIEGITLLRMIIKMKWLFICVWLISILFFFLGKIKPTHGKTLSTEALYQHRSIPYLFVLERKISIWAFCFERTLCWQYLITENCHVFQHETFNMVEHEQKKMRKIITLASTPL